MHTKHHSSGYMLRRPIHTHRNIVRSVRVTSLSAVTFGNRKLVKLPATLHSPFSTLTNAYYSVHCCPSAARETYYRKSNMNKKVTRIKVTRSIKINFWQKYYNYLKSERSCFDDFIYNVGDNILNNFSLLHIHIQSVYVCQYLYEKISWKERIKFFQNWILENNFIFYFSTEFFTYYRIIFYLVILLVLRYSVYDKSSTITNITIYNYWFICDGR